MTKLDDKKADVDPITEPSPSMPTAAQSNHAATFQRRKRRQFVAALPFFAIVIAMLLGGELNVGRFVGIPESLVLPIVAIAVLSFFGFSLANWRCPACNRYLGQRLNPKTCPYCGVGYQV